MAANKILREKIMQAMRRNNSGVNRIDLKRQIGGGVSGRQIADEMKYMDNDGLLSYDANLNARLRNNNVPDEVVNRRRLTGQQSDRWRNPSR